MNKISATAMPEAPQISPEGQSKTAAGFCSFSHISVNKPQSSQQQVLFHFHVVFR